MTTDGRTDGRAYYTESPCGHGKLVDVVPSTCDGVSWGIDLVVLRDGEAEPKACCSAQEGEHASEEDALLACEYQKRYAEGQLLQALAVLECAASEAWSMARVTLDDLFVLRKKLAEFGGSRRTCEAALCFEEGTTMWIVDEERDARFCEEHLKGRKVYGRGSEEIVFTSWKDYEGAVA